MNTFSHRLLDFVYMFWKPLIILIILLLSLFLYSINLHFVADIVLICVMVVGSIRLFYESFVALFHKKFVLDYIALTAIVVSFITGEYVAGTVIVLMLTGGQTLEDYGVAQAKRSLTSLIDRIPHEVFLWEQGGIGRRIAIGDVKVQQEIVVRKGEVIPLDGILVSDSGLTDESSLTGEPYEIDKRAGDQIRSGTVNIGELLVVRVLRTETDSTYRKIVDMVRAASEEKAPLVRLADKYSTVFTFATFAICAFAYYISGDLSRVLAVLVIATPCPLILATPIALMGGVNASAKRRIIVKNLSSLEILSRVTSIIFDKTGTVTLGLPIVTLLEIVDSAYSEKDVVSIAASIERNSLHPLAKSIVTYGREKGVNLVDVSSIEEVIGKGIQGAHNGKTYLLSKGSKEKGMLIDMYCDDRLVAHFHFEDEIKKDARDIFVRLQKIGLQLAIYTGDKAEAVQKLLKRLDIKAFVRAECTPEDKQDGILHLQKQGIVTAMVGDGINDAPALALADVGMVFSHEEQTAASEAADIVFLGGDFESVLVAKEIADKTIRIALQSIFWGIGLSILGQVVASFGYIPAVWGAVAQEAIDVAVILNALRASR